MKKIIDPSSKELQDALLVIAEYKSNPNGYDYLLKDQSILSKTVENLSESKKLVDEFDKIVQEIPSKYIPLIMYFISRDNLRVKNIKSAIYEDKIRKLYHVVKKLNEFPLWCLERHLL